MSAEVLFSIHAADRLRDIGKHDPSAVREILDALKRFASEPGVVVRSDRENGPRSFVAGKYRILFSTDEEGGRARLYVLGSVPVGEAPGSEAEAREVLVSATG